MKRQHNRSERVSSIICLESLIEAAQQREWRKAQERKRTGTRLGLEGPSARERVGSERHACLN